MTQQTTTDARPRERGNGSGADKASDAVKSNLSEATAVASDVGQRVADAAQTSMHGLDGALKRLDDEPEATLTIGAAFSLGLATGLLAGGGPRILALVCAIPGVAMALTLLRRSEAARVS